MTVSFEKMPGVLPGVDTWGATVGDATCMVSFDHKHPAYGYHASIKLGTGSTQELSDTFKTFGRARKAVVKVAERRGMDS